MNRIAITLTWLLFAGCNASAERDLPPGPEVTEAIASAAGRALPIQSGAKLFVLGVTDDNYAIYQDGTTIYATALVPGARRHLIATTGSAIGVNHPLVFASGKVAFIYPDSDFSGTTVSRLFVWTAAAGPKLAAAASLGAPGLFVLPIR
jgi:hypothetical protein